MSTFSEMVSAMPAESLAISASIVKIDEQLVELNSQKTNITNDVLSVMVSASNAYHQDKIVEFTDTLTPTVSTGTGYGVMDGTRDGSDNLIGNITEWVIVSGGLHIWTSSDVTSMSPSANGDYQQWERQIGYPEVIDHLYRDFGEDDTPTETHGIQANIDGLELGKTILERDKVKLDAMYDIYSSFT